VLGLDSAEHVATTGLRSDLTIDWRKAIPAEDTMTEQHVTATA